MDPECEEGIDLQAVFETPLGLDDGFAEAGGHSILIARLAQKLQSAGWLVPVRALLSDCKHCSKSGQPATGAPAGLQGLCASVKSGELSAERDEAAAEVFSIGYFTTLQVLSDFLVFPAHGGVPQLFSTSSNSERSSRPASLWRSHRRLLLYLLALVTPFASLFWS